MLPVPQRKQAGRDLGPDEPFQFVEEEIMRSSDYDVSLEKGWGAWNNDFMKKIQTPISSTMGSQ